MAVSNDNVITRGATGTFAGQIVFRQRFGKTIMCKMPKPYPPKTATQIANQERFKRANDFAKAAIKDPVKKAYYQSIAKPTQTAFNAAFQDAYHKPAVEVTVTKEKVIIKTKGKHRVEKVKVTILDASGIEKGDGFAVSNQGLSEWEALLHNRLVEGGIRVRVYDIAGNVCSKDIQQEKDVY